jgi:hypothetical protein
LSLRVCSPCVGSRPPCAKAVSLTTSTVGLRLSSLAMRPPGRYSAARAWMQPSQLRMASSRGMPNSSAASMKAPGVTYLQQANTHRGTTRLNTCLGGRPACQLSPALLLAFGSPLGGPTVLLVATGRVLAAPFSPLLLRTSALLQLHLRRCMCVVTLAVAR